MARVEEPPKVAEAPAAKSMSAAETIACAPSRRPCGMPGRPLREAPGRPQDSGSPKPLSERRGRSDRGGIAASAARVLTVRETMKRSCRKHSVGSLRPDWCTSPASQ